jgi:hypothetical protein
MNTTIKTAELIRQRIEAMPIGEPFTPTALLECGTRASVDQTLSRLVKAGSIERVTRGVFVRPEVKSCLAASSSRSAGQETAVSLTPSK